MIRRTVVAAVCLCFVSFPALISSGSPSGQSSATEVYKAGPIVLSPDPAFGKNTEWNLLFYYLYCDLTVAPDGSIFIASSRQHKIFKFDPEGNLIKTFGQKGNGPGDFNSPDGLSVLDGKYLVVGEYASSHRISLFDLEGNFKQVLKTDRPPFWPVALRDGTIAYIVHNFRGEGTADVTNIESVVLRSIEGGAEKKVAEFTFTYPAIITRQGVTLTFGDATNGQTFIGATRDGNLIVGISLRPVLDVYSPAGVKLLSIDLDIEPIPVTRRYRNQYKDYQVGQLKQDSRYSQGRFKEMVQDVERASFDHLFADHLPLYREIMTDAEGNLMVFRNTECLGDCPILVQVYSPEGTFVCETELKEGPFRLAVDPRVKNVAFGSEGLVAMVEVKDAEDFELRVIRVNYRNCP